MYTDFYKLDTKPFQISSDPSFIWLGEKHKEALATLRYSVIDNKGLMLLTGDVGTGKTTLINTLLESLGNDVYYASVPDPRLELIDFLNYIAQAFHIDGEFTSKGSFLLHFGWFLETVYKQDKKALLIVDEAQLLTQDLLEEIRLLSNIHRDGNHLLNIFFVGQNEFNEILHRPENRAVTQRITLNYQISPLSLEETKLYVRHRLKVAGASRSLFSPSAIKAIAVYSGGIPRRINVICDHCLLTGYIGEKEKIDEKIVKECVKDIAIPQYNQSSQSGRKGTLDQENDSKGRQFRLSGPALALSLLSVMLLSVIAVTLVNPDLSGKIVSSYQRGVEHLFSKSDVSPVEQRPEEGGELSKQAETVVVDGAVEKRSSEIALENTETTGVEAQPAPIAADTNMSDNAELEVAAQSIGVTTAGDDVESELNTLSTAPETDIQENKEESSVRQAEETQEEQDTTYTASAPSEQPETVSPATGSQSPAASQEKQSVELSEILVVESPPGEEEENVVIRFENNSNDFSTSNLDQLIKLGLSIKNQPNVSLDIIGYTDSAGPDEYNNRLSLVRATMVKSYLLGLGIDPGRMTVNGYGSLNPIADNATREGRRLNRRVEVEVVRP